MCIRDSDHAVLYNIPEKRSASQEVEFRCV